MHTLLHSSGRVSPHTAGGLQRCHLRWVIAEWGRNSPASDQQPGGCEQEPPTGGDSRIKAEGAKGKPGPGAEPSSSAFQRGAARGMRSTAASRRCAPPALCASQSEPQKRRAHAEGESGLNL